MQVEQIVNQGIAQANKTLAAIRLPVGGATAGMVFSVSDPDGNVLGLYRMTDATIFSIEFAVAKGRNVTYYASTNLQSFDRVPVNDVIGQPFTPPYNPAYLPIGTAFTNRTFRFFVRTAVPVRRRRLCSRCVFHSSRNWSTQRPATTKPWRQFPTPISIPCWVTTHSTLARISSDTVATVNNRNGVVFFPGSSPLYVMGVLSGGFGVSGDGVDQDDVVTFYGRNGFRRPAEHRADRFFVRGVRLPYEEVDRNALA